MNKQAYRIRRQLRKLKIFNSVKKYCYILQKD